EAMREGWFHTGDGFKQDNDGNYYFVDRIKDAIRRRGENISSFEVEGFISRFPGIAECAAVAVPSETGEDEIMVHFVSTSGATVDLDALAQFCREQMPGFMVPRFFRQVAALPYTPTNKVQKRLLRASGTEGAWERSNGNGAGRPRMVSGQ
ncbi:MAG: AMP-binding protein, partial [Hyphomonas sp.]|nr:AMP-binding protein [Hyphomonas sp.]